MQRLLVLAFLVCLVVPANLNAEDAEDCINRGNASYKKGEYDKAIAAYTEAIRLDSKYEHGYALRGFAWGKKGEYVKAIADFNEAIRLNPNNPSLYGARGIAWKEKGEYDNAIADYNQVLKLRPKDAVAYYVRGNTYHDKGEYDKAIADYAQALAINPKFVKVYYNRGNAWLGNREYGKAIADFNEAVAINPKFAAAFNSLAWLQSTCPDKKYRDAKKAAENASKAYQLDGGKSWGYLDTLAAAYAENGEFEKAKEWQARAIELAAIDKSATAKNRADANSRLELYKQGKPYREEPKQKSQWEAARAALIEMVKAGKHEELKMALPQLRSDPIIADGADFILIGKWHVNLKDRTFVVDVVAGPIFAEYSGKFTEDKSGVWRAEITSEKHN